MMTPSEEDFELELRSLPGVLSVGVDHREDGEVDSVTLFVRGQDPESVRHVALQVASLYYPTAAVTVEDANRAPVARRGEGARVALIRTDFNVHEGVSEVELAFAGRTGVGRSGSGALIGGAEATLSALREIGYEVPFFLVAVNSIATMRGWPVIVTLPLRPTPARPRKLSSTSLTPSWTLKSVRTRATRAPSPRRADGARFASSTVTAAVG